MKEPIDDPQVVEMEKYVIGAMMCCNGKIIPKVASLLTAADFYRPENKLLFNYILKLYNQNIMPDALLISEELRKDNKFGTVSLAYLLSLPEKVNTLNCIPAYCKVIKEKARKRSAIKVAENLSEKLFVDKESAAALISEALTAFNELSLEEGTENISDFNEYFANSFQSDVEVLKSYKDRKTGFDNLDARQFFLPGLYTLGALTSLGKTTFCWQMAEQLAKNGETCIYVSLEMTKLELASKSIARELYKCEPNSSLTAANIRLGGFSNTVNEIVADFAKSKLPLKVLEARGVTVEDLIRLLQPYCTSDKAPVIFIDYLQWIKHDKDNAKMAVDDIVRKLKDFQLATKTTIILISSFNRQNYSLPVSLESFKESGDIEYGADSLLGLQLYAVNKLKESNIILNRKIIASHKKHIPRAVQLVGLKNRYGNVFEDVYFLYYPNKETFVPCTEKDCEAIYEEIDKAMKLPTSADDSSEQVDTSPSSDSDYDFEEDE